MFDYVVDNGSPWSTMVDLSSLCGGDEHLSLFPVPELMGRCCMYYMCINMCINVYIHIQTYIYIYVHMYIHKLVLIGRSAWSQPLSGTCLTKETSIGNVLQTFGALVNRAEVIQRLVQRPVVRLAALAHLERNHKSVFPLGGVLLRTTSHGSSSMLQTCLPGTPTSP